MSEERQDAQDVAEQTREVREHEQAAREHAPEEQRPEERGPANTAGEAADLQGG